MPNSSPSAQNPARDVARVVVRTVGVVQPLSWLARAWHDLTRCGWISVLHGVAIALAGALTADRELDKTLSGDDW